MIVRLDTAKLCERERNLATSETQKATVALRRTLSMSTLGLLNILVGPEYIGGEPSLFAPTATPKNPILKSSQGTCIGSLERQIPYPTMPTYVEHRISMHHHRLKRHVRGSSGIGTIIASIGTLRFAPRIRQLRLFELCRLVVLTLAFGAPSLLSLKRSHRPTATYGSLKT